MATDISNLLDKQNNSSQAAATETIPANEKLTAEEFRALVQAVHENQQSVKSVKMGSQVYTPVEGQVTLPYTAEGTEVRLLTTDSLTSVVSVTGQMKLHLLFSSTQSGYDTGNSGTLFIQTYANGQWTTQGSEPLPSKSQTAAYDEIDITKYLATGANRVRLYVVDDGFGTASNYLIFDSVVLTALKLELATEYHKPFTNNTMELAYYIHGAGVAKALHMKVSGVGGSGFREIVDEAVGLNTYQTEAYNPQPITDTSSQTVKVITHGVHTVEAWLTCVDGDGNELESEHIFNSFMIVTDPSDMTPYLLIQDLRKEVVNYEQLKLMDFAVYNPSGETIPVAISLTDYSGDVEYLRLEPDATPNNPNTVTTTVEVENDTDDLIYSYLHFYRYEGDGANKVEKNFLLESTGNEAEIIEVDNVDKFSPTSGADFFLNPKVRNNSESNPARILNSAKQGSPEIPGVVFENFGFVNDAWVTAEDNQRVLRVLAGQYLTIPYEPFVDFQSSPGSSMTLEIDFKTRNITNEVDPIFRVCSTVAATGKPLGLFMRALDGFVFTQSQSTEADQNFGWMEGVRTHIAINIVHALRSSATSSTTIALVRVFVNGVLNREFPFDNVTANEFITNLGHGGIRIGQDDADIDIYSIRCYRKALSSNNCMQDYLSTLPTSVEKKAFRDANKITDNGVISYAKAKEKYNVLVWHGEEPKRAWGDISDDYKTYGWLEISMLNPDGTPDNAHSGTIGKKYGRLPCKGQGSTAKTYYYWNAQWDINKSVDKDKNTITDDGWVDGNGKDNGMKYKLSDDIEAGTKMVLKINYASSMQSHKQGATEMYNALHTAIVGKNSMQKEKSKARVAVLERPFLWFVQESGDTEPQFRGLGTFGPGKMDKKTWGYSSDTFPDFSMMEGSDNNKPLTDMRVPWDEKVSYNVDEEYFEYNGDGNIDFDAGLTYGKEVDGVETDPDVLDGTHVSGQPKDAIVDYYKEAWNWLFMHNPQIVPYTAGNFEAFTDDPTVDNKLQYWMTQSGGGASMYDVYRYDFVDEAWVPAGLRSYITASGYATKNLKTIYPNALNGISVGAWAEMNQAFINAIVEDARQNIGNYWNTKSLLFHYAFVIHLIAGTDNCSKNTYYVLDPVTHLLEMHADDLDTIFKTDNSGYQIKPYYIDRMHPFAEDGTLLFTEGNNNVLCNLIELMWENDGDATLPSMMREILNGMANLINSDDLKAGLETSPWGAFQKYFFSIQEYFPAVAYNETARIRYEYPASIGYVSDRNVKPISQSLGDQLQSEKQYMKRRLVYIASYAAYGEFALNGNNGFGFNTYYRVNGSAPTAILDITPHQYIYPTARIGQTLRNPHVRLAPGETYHFVMDNSGNLGDTVCGLKGGNYYRSFGNLGDLSVKPDNDFTMNGERIVEIIANPINDPEFRPSKLIVNTGLVKRVSLRGSAYLGGQLDLSNCIRLRELDIRDTRVTSLKFPASRLLTSIQCGGYLTGLEVSNLPNLRTLTLQAYTYLTSLVIGDNVGELDLYQTIAELYDAKHNETDPTRKLNALSVRNVEWNNVAADFIAWLVTIENVKITGKITLLSSQYMTFELKKALYEKFGNIDDLNNPLQVVYTQRQISSVEIGGDNTFREPGARKFTVIPNSENANNFISIKWSLPNSSFATVDPNTGVVTVTKISETVMNLDLTCTVVTTERTLVATKALYLYDRPAQLGDYVFADGTYSDMLDPLKTVVGICFYLGETDAADGVPDRRMVALKPVSGYNGATSMPWGLYSGDNTNGITGITVAGLSNAYNIAGIAEFTSSGLANGSINKSPWYIEDDNYRDINNGDKYGFKTGFAANTGAGDLQLVKLTSSQEGLSGVGFKDGRLVPSGMQHTLAIIDHRNTLLDGVNLPIPAAQYAGGKQTETETENLRTLIGQIIANNGNSARYQQYYYPAASFCYAYEPTDLKPGEVLADKFKAHNWYLPSSGELAREYWYYRQGLASDLNIFKAAINGGIMTNFTSSYHWSSSEYNQTHAWYVNFSNGIFNTTSKYGSYVVRAVSAF